MRSPGARGEQQGILASVLQLFGIRFVTFVVLAYRGSESGVEMLCIERATLRLKYTLWEKMDIPLCP